MAANSWELVQPGTPKFTEEVATSSWAASFVTYSPTKASQLQLKPEVTESPIPTTVIDRLIPPEAGAAVAGCGEVVVVVVVVDVLLFGG
jgi:hypothetical protein